MLSIRIFEASPHSWLMLSNVASKRNISELVRTDSKGVVMKSFMASDWGRVFNWRSVCRGYLKISGSLSQGGIVIQAAGGGSKICILLQKAAQIACRMDRM